MQAIETNVIVRYLTGDDPAQTARARAVVDADDVFIATTVLLEELLEPMDVTQTEPAKHPGVPIQRINELVKGKRGVTPDRAWLLGKALATRNEVGIPLQNFQTSNA